MRRIGYLVKIKIFIILYRLTISCSNFQIKWVQQQIALNLIPSTIQFSSISIPFSKQIRSMLSWANLESTEKMRSQINGSVTLAETCIPLNDEFWPRQYYIVILFCSLNRQFCLTFNVLSLSKSKIVGIGILTDRCVI